LCYKETNMEKKEVYEHLARIYLDASLKYKKKSKYPKGLFILLLGILGVAFLLLIIPKSPSHKISSDNKLSIVLVYEPVKINYNFDPTKKEIYDIELNNINLEKFKTLSFRIKKSSFDDIVHLKIEFVNKFNESSSVYLKDISNRWSEFKISLSDFKISNWSAVKKLMFIVEEWNTNNKTGKIYIDDIKISK